MCHVECVTVTQVYCKKKNERKKNYTAAKDGNKMHGRMNNKIQNN